MMFFSQAIVRICAVITALGLATASAGASQTTCTVCSPPSGSLGYVWFTLTVGASFTCVTGSQTTTTNYNSALAGFRSDGTIGVIRFTDANNFTREVLISGGTACTVRM